MAEISTFRRQRSDGFDDPPGLSILSNNNNNSNSMHGSCGSSSSNNPGEHSYNVLGASTLNMNRGSRSSVFGSNDQQQHIPGTSMLPVDASTVPSVQGQASSSLGRSSAGGGGGSGGGDKSSSRTRSLGSVNQTQDVSSLVPGASAFFDRSVSSDVNGLDVQQLIPGTSTFRVNSSASSDGHSRGSIDRAPGASTFDLNRSLSNQSGNSVGGFPGSSTMYLSGNPGESMLSVDQSVTLPRRGGANVIRAADHPGMEVVETRTLPTAGRPHLQPGISVVESDECQSAPVQCKPFHFPTDQRQQRRHQASAGVAGSSLLEVNNNNNNNDDNGSGGPTTDPGESESHQRILQPGTSIIQGGDSGSTTTTTTIMTHRQLREEDQFTTALMFPQTDAATAGERQTTQMKRQDSSSEDGDYSFLSFLP